MRVVCAKCGDLFESLIIDRELAWKELNDKTSKHANTHHRQDFVTVAEAIKLGMAAIMLVMHVNEFVVIPTKETYLIDKMNQARDALMIAAGFDPVDDEESENDEELAEEEVKPSDPSNEESDKGLAEVVNIKPSKSS